MTESNNESLAHLLHKKYGFLVLPSNPTKAHEEEYLRVCQRMGRTDLPFTPAVAVLYERQLSWVTELLIEGAIARTPTGLSLGYRYDFYKARYFHSCIPQEIKIYCQQATRKELLRVLQKFTFLEMEKNND